MLREQEHAGIVRANAKAEVLGRDDIELALFNRKIDFDPNATLDEKRQLLSLYSRRRHIKVWHDHGKIAGHGHFLVLVLVSGIYDPAFYYTEQELQEMGMNVDVVNVVERPEIHIIARSGSADCDQMAYSESRVECLLEIDSSIKTQSSQPITDIVRFFHGDHPAQQFEAGNARGGIYPCVTCSTHRRLFDDLSYVYRQPVITLAHRQHFLLQGKAWRNGGIRPLEGLSKTDLQSELQTRVHNGSISRPRTAPSLAKMKKKELQQELTEVRKGISNFPALVASNPEASMNDLNIQDYEVASPEPLHDFKGHMQNLINEIRKTSTPPIKEEVDAIYKSTLDKDTVRCVDYRKASILLCNAFASVCPETNLHVLLRSAVEMCDVMYSAESSRSQRLILRFHNLTFQHSLLRIDMFSSPASVTKQKMFRSYFHSLSCHAATFYRIVSLRSLNSESQERLFNTCNDITKATSNIQAKNLLQNILIRTHAECYKTALKSQESEVRSLASTLAPFENTTFTKTWINKHPCLWQTHLERIADFLLCGANVWWKDCGDSIQFIDGTTEEEHKAEGSPLHHFRTWNVSRMSMTVGSPALRKKLHFPLK